MKATGIVRRIDELGRVVIPKEIRRTQRIRRGDPLEIFTTGDGEVIFKKYSPMGEVNTLAAQLAEVLSRQFALTAFVLRQGPHSGGQRQRAAGADRPQHQPAAGKADGSPQALPEPRRTGKDPAALRGRTPGAAMRRTGTGGRGRDRRGGSVDRGPRRLPGGRPVQGRGSGGGLSGKADGGVRRDD